MNRIKDKRCVQIWEGGPTHFIPCYDCALKIEMQNKHKSLYINNYQTGVFTVYLWNWLLRAFGPFVLPILLCLIPNLLRILRPYTPVSVFWWYFPPGAESRLPNVCSKFRSLLICRFKVLRCIARTRSHFRICPSSMHTVFSF